MEADKPTERAPIFTRWDIYDDGTPYEDPQGLYVHHADVLAKITSGELITKEALEVRIASGELIPRGLLAKGQMVYNDPVRGYRRAKLVPGGVFTFGPELTKEEFDLLVLRGAEVIPSPSKGT